MIAKGGFCVEAAARAREATRYFEFIKKTMAIRDNVNVKNSV